MTVVIGDVASDSVAGPDRAIGCCDGNCVAVPPDDLARGAFKAFGSMRIMQIEASSAEAAFEAGAAIGAPNFPKHLAGVIARPVDDAIPLVHRGLPTRGRHPSWDKVAALEAGDGFQNGGGGGLGDFIAVEARFRSRPHGKIGRRPNRPRIHFALGLKHGHAPTANAFQDGPIECGGTAVALDARMHD